MLLEMMFLLQKLKLFLTKSVDSILLEMIWAITSGFYGKLFPRSGILKEHLLTVTAGVIDSDFRGKVAALLFNHHPEKTFTVCTGDRIAQVVFMKKFTANFQRVTNKQLLGITKRGSDGFGSTGVSVIKKKKALDNNEVQTPSEKAAMNADNKAQVYVSSEDNLAQTTSEEAVMTADKEVEFNAASSEEPQITSEEAIITIFDKVIVHESIIVD